MPRARFGSNVRAPTFTLGTVADQVDLSAPAMPGISGLSATGTPTYAWTLTDPLGADASALLTGPTTATPTCAALSTWTGAKLCGRWTGTVTVTDSAGSTTKSFGWTVGVSGRMRRKTLSFAGVTHDFKTQGATVVIDGVTLTAANEANAQVLRITGGYLEIQPNDANVPYTSSSQVAPYVTFDPVELNPSFTRYGYSRLQFLVPTPPDTAASLAELLLGWQGESATIANVVRIKGGATRNVNAYQIISGGSNTTGDTAAVAKLAVVERYGEQFSLYYGTTAAFLELGAAGQTLLRKATHSLTMSSTDYWDGGTKVLIAGHYGGTTGTPSLMQISDIRLDCEV